MSETYLRNIVNKYFKNVPKNHTYILNIDRFWNKVDLLRKRIFKTIIVNHDTFEVDYLKNNHKIYEKKIKKINTKERKL